MLDYNTEHVIIYMSAGPMPSSWGDAGAYLSLSFLSLVDNPLTGTLPAAWGGRNAFPALSELAFGMSSQVGTLPPEWGSPTAYQQLRILTIYECNITGVCACVFTGPSASKAAHSL